MSTAWITCDICHGKARVVVDDGLGVTMPCPYCDGTGQRFDTHSLTAFWHFLDNVLVAVALAAAEQRGYERGREEGEDHMLGCWRFAAATSSP